MPYGVGVGSVVVVVVDSVVVSGATVASGVAIGGAVAAGVLVVVVVLVLLFILCVGEGFTIVVFVSVVVGVASGAAVSVFCSQAARSAAPARMQMYFFIFCVGCPRGDMVESNRQDASALLRCKSKGPTFCRNAG